MRGEASDESAAAFGGAYRFLSERRVRSDVKNLRYSGGYVKIGQRNTDVSFPTFNIIWLLAAIESSSENSLVLTSVIDFYISSCTLPCIVIGSPHIPLAVSSDRIWQRKFLRNCEIHHLRRVISTGALLESPRWSEASLRRKKRMEGRKKWKWKGWPSILRLRRVSGNFAILKPSEVLRTCVRRRTNFLGLLNLRQHVFPMHFKDFGL